MKSKFLAFIALCLCVSCTKTIYSGQEVINSYRTKSQVIQQYGLPGEKRQDGEYTEYYYDYGSGAISSSYVTGNANASATTIGNTVYGSASGSGYGIGNVTRFNRYVKFTFDKDDRVIAAESRGVDMAVKKPALGRTIIAVVLLFGAGVGLAAAADPN